MGRLPSQWGDRDITMRIPYSMPGEIIMTGNQSGVQFPDVTFTNNIDMPFEGHRMIPRVVALDDANNALPTQPPQELLQNLVRARINDFGKNVIMVKNPAFFDTLVKGSSERTWEWADPYYLIRSEGFQVICDTVTLIVWDGNQIPVTPPTVPLISLRIEVTFQGFLLQVAPPSNTR